MFSLTQLEYIVAVDREGSFKKAAKSCFVTQPTLSMQIQKLEDHLGVLIFDRSKKPIQTSPMGAQLVEQARLILAQARRLTELIQQDRQEIAGDLRLAVIPTLAPYLLPLFLRGFQAKYPAVNLLIEESKTSDIVDRLRRNQIDVGILVTPLFEAQLSEHPLFLEPFYVYAPASSSLAQLTEIGEADLEPHPMLLLSEGHCLREQVLKVCRRRQRDNDSGGERLAFESGSIETLCRLVEDELGFTIVPELALNSLRGRSAHIVPFVSPQPSREVSLIVHRTFSRQAVLMALQTAIMAALPTGLQQPRGKLKRVGI